MCRINPDLVRKLQDLVVQTVIEHLAELFLCETNGSQQVRPSHIANEERVPGQEHLRHGVVCKQIKQLQGNALGGMPGGFHGNDAHGLPKLQGRSVEFRHEIKLRLGLATQVNLRPGALPQLQMPRQEVRMKVGQIHMLNLPTVLLCLRQIGLNIPLGIHHHGTPGRRVSDEVRSVGQTSQIMLLEVHWEVRLQGGVAPRSVPLLSLRGTKPLQVPRLLEKTPQDPVNRPKMCSWSPSGRVPWPIFWHAAWAKSMVPKTDSQRSQTIWSGN